MRLLLRGCRQQAPMALLLLTLLCLLLIVLAVVKAGFTGRLDSVTDGVNPLSIKPCPQSHWCNETVLTTQGSVAAHPCGQGLWTKEMGAKSPTECSE